jgi:hypothetical protein
MQAQTLINQLYQRWARVARRGEDVVGGRHVTHLSHHGFHQSRVGVAKAKKYLLRVAHLHAFAGQCVQAQKQRELQGPSDATSARRLGAADFTVATALLDRLIYH